MAISGSSGHYERRIARSDAILGVVDTTEPSTTAAATITIAVAAGQWINFAWAARYEGTPPTTARAATVISDGGSTIETVEHDILAAQNGSVIEYFGAAQATGAHSSVTLTLHPYGNGVTGSNAYISYPRVWVASAPSTLAPPEPVFGYWDDLVFPAGGINPLGNVGDPDISLTTGMLLFGATGTELIAGSAQLPHQRIPGTEVRFHMHTRSTTDPGGTGDVLWRLEYKWTSVNGYTAASYTTVDALQTLSDHVGGEAKHEVVALSTIAGTGKTSSSILEWRISRIGGDASDTYAADAEMMSLDFHFLRDGFGTSSEY